MTLPDRADTAPSGPADDRCTCQRHLMRSVEGLTAPDIYLLSWIAESFAARRRQGAVPPAPDEPAKPA